MPYRSGFFGAATGCGISPKHVVVAAIIEDQKATQSSIGMTISPLSIGQSKSALEQRSCCTAVPATDRDTDA
jgi:hypothetical protein